MLSGAEIKREIIANAKNSPFRSQIEKVPDGMTEDDQIEIGNALEAMTKTSGWTIVERYMITRANVVGMAMNDNVSDSVRGVAKGFIELMQWVEISVNRKNEIEEKNEKAKSVSKDEKE